jgi:hypothetical protein
MDRIAWLGSLGRVYGSGTASSRYFASRRSGREEAWIRFPSRQIHPRGAAEACRGEDLFEIKKPFRLRPGQFILSGGSGPTEPIVVDDDLEVSSGEKVAFIDDDHVKSTETRKNFGGFSCTYSGAPIILVLDQKAKLRILAIDTFGPDAELGELYLHRHDGARRRLTEHIQQQSNRVLPHIFFSKEFALDGSFEPAPSIKEETKEVMLMPAILASLLPTRKGPDGPQGGSGTRQSR